jgi:hypothetical protein
MRRVKVIMVVNRIRGGAWQALRHRHPSAHPLCVVCMPQGCVISATEHPHSQRPLGPAMNQKPGELDKYSY